MFFKKKQLTPVEEHEIVQEMSTYILPQINEIKNIIINEIKSLNFEVIPALESQCINQIEKFSSIFVEKYELSNRIINTEKPQWAETGELKAITYTYVEYYFFDDQQIYIKDILKEFEKSIKQYVTELLNFIFQESDENKDHVLNNKEKFFLINTSLDNLKKTRLEIEKTRNHFSQLHANDKHMLFDKKTKEIIIKKFNDLANELVSYEKKEKDINKNIETIINICTYKKVKEIDSQLFVNFTSVILQSTSFFNNKLINYLQKNIWKYILNDYYMQFTYHLSISVQITNLMDLFNEKYPTGRKKVVLKPTLNNTNTPPNPIPTAIQPLPPPSPTNNKINEYNEKIKKLEKDNEQFKDEIEELKVDIIKYKDEISRINDTNHDLLQENNNLINQIELKDKTIEETIEKLNEYEITMKSNRVKIEEYDNMKIDLEETKKTLEENEKAFREDYEEQTNRFQTSLKSFKKLAYENLDLQKKHDELKTEHNDLNEKYTKILNIKNEVSKLNNDLQIKFNELEEKYKIDIGKQPILIETYEKNIRDLKKDKLKTDKLLKTILENNESLIEQNNILMITIKDLNIQIENLKKDNLYPSSKPNNSKNIEQKILPYKNQYNVFKKN